MKINTMLKLGALCAVTICGVSQASPTDTTQVGKTARDALELQRSGRQSVETRPMLKDAADRSYERYLDSFTHPIPDQFDRETSFTEGS